MYNGGFIFIMDETEKKILTRHGGEYESYDPTEEETFFNRLDIRKWFDSSFYKIFRSDLLSRLSDNSVGQWGEAIRIQQFQDDEPIQYEVLPEEMNFFNKMVNHFMRKNSTVKIDKVGYALLIFRGLCNSFRDIVTELIYSWHNVIRIEFTPGIIFIQLTPTKRVVLYFSVNFKHSDPVFSILIKEQNQAQKTQDLELRLYTPEKNLDFSDIRSILKIKLVGRFYPFINVTASNRISLREVGSVERSWDEDFYENNRSLRYRRFYPNHGGPQYSREGHYQLPVLSVHDNQKNESLGKFYFDYTSRFTITIPYTGWLNIYSYCELYFLKSGYTLFVTHFDIVLINPEFKKAYFIEREVGKKGPRQLQELVTQKIINQNLDTREWPSMVRKTAKTIESRPKFHPEGFNEKDYPFYIYRPESEKPLYFSEVDPITYSEPSQRPEKRPSSSDYSTIKKGKHL